jgi:hypothetical protein
MHIKTPRYIADDKKRESRYIAPPTLKELMKK